MSGFLKVLEENALDIVVVLPSDKVDGFVEKVYTHISTYITGTGKHRIVFHVVTDLDKPLYLEHFRRVLQTNISYTITLRHYPLSKSVEVVKELLSNRRELQVFTPPGLDELVKNLESLGVKIYVIE